MISLIDPESDLPDWLPIVKTPDELKAAVESVPLSELFIKVVILLPSWKEENSVTPVLGTPEG